MLDSQILQGLSEKIELLQKSLQEQEQQTDKANQRYNELMASLTSPAQAKDYPNNLKIVKRGLALKGDGLEAGAMPVGAVEKYVSDYLDNGYKVVSIMRVNDPNNMNYVDLLFILAKE